jgi:signal transduction histidine kinase
MVNGALTWQLEMTGDTGGVLDPDGRGSRRSRPRMQAELKSNSREIAVSKAARAVSRASARLAERDHELRAALFAIEVAAAGLSRHRDHMTSRQVDELMDGLVAETRRVRSLLHGGEVTSTTFDLGDAIAPVLACARVSGLDVRSSVPSGIRVEGSPDSTAQVVVALLDNVRRHAASSPVEIHVELDDDTVTLSIVDRGPGIDHAVCERMFERGVRGGQSAGTGLGLYVARRLMEEQRGTIDVRTAPGAGAEFVLGFRRA